MFTEIQWWDSGLPAFQMAGEKHLWKVGASPISQESKPSRDKARVTPPCSTAPRTSRGQQTFVKQARGCFLRKTRLPLAPKWWFTEAETQLWTLSTKLACARFFKISHILRVKTNFSLTQSLPDCLFNEPDLEPGSTSHWEALRQHHRVQASRTEYQTGVRVTSEYRGA